MMSGAHVRYRTSTGRSVKDVWCYGNLKLKTAIRHDEREITSSITENYNKEKTAMITTIK
jgi:hypothetical protein